MLIEVHMLQNHAPSNLNRDDTGSPKEAVFGGYKRARISSQCLKRSIRRSDIFQALFSEAGEASTRTRSLPVIVRRRLLEAANTRADEAGKDALLSLADLAAQKLTVIAKTEKKGDGGKKQKEDEPKKPVTAQTIFFRSEEIDLLCAEVEKRILWDAPLEKLLSATKGQNESHAKKAINDPELPKGLKDAIDRLWGSPDVEDDEEVPEEAPEEVTEDGGGKRKSAKKTIHDRLKTLSLRHGSPVALAKAAGVGVNARMPVDMALFGRMVTNPAFWHVEASSQFAHAISTHKIDHEFDYYTAVDDLERAADDEAGSGADMIGDVEFNSACYYKYFNIHVEGLVDNLTGKAFKRQVSAEDEKNARQTAGKASRALVEAACRVTPSGKQNSFAAHQLPSLLWIEIREKNLPVSYANAFCNPVNTKAKIGLELESANALKKECETLTGMYGLEARKRLLLAAKGDQKILDVASSENLKTILDQLEEEVQRG
jgi:CRISPR system Cascade subunit CasC